MASRWMMGILVVLLASPASAQETAFATNEAGLRKLAEAVRGNSKLLATLRPDYEACVAIAATQADAIRFFDHVSRLYRRLPKDGIRVPAERTKIQIAAVHPHDASKPNVPFADPLHTIAKQLSDNAAFFAVRYHAPGQDKGTTLHSFVPVNGRWFLFPSLVHAARNKNLHSDVKWMFFEALSAGRFDDAYSVSSAHITEQVDAAGFVQLIRKTAWREHRKIDWTGFRQLTGLGTVVMEWYGTVQFADGREANLTAYGRPENGDWKIILFNLDSGFGISPPSLYAPTPQRCREIARNITRKLVTAIHAKDFEPFHRLLAKELREKIDIAKLAKAFEELSKSGDLTFLINGEVKLRFSPTVGTGDYPRPISRIELLRKRGALNVHGWIRNKEAKKQLGFQLALVYEDEKFRPVRITYGLPEAYKE